MMASISLHFFFCWLPPTVDKAILEALKALHGRASLPLAQQAWGNEAGGPAQHEVLRHLRAMLLSSIELAEVGKFRILVKSATPYRHP